MPLSDLGAMRRNNRREFDRIVGEALARAPDQGQAALMLGVSRRTLVRWLRLDRALLQAKSASIEEEKAEELLDVLRHGHPEKVA
jgi:hypothetical protein